MDRLPLRWQGGLVLLGAVAISVLVGAVLAPSLGVGFLGDDLERIWRAAQFDPDVSGLAYQANHWRLLEDVSFRLNHRAAGLDSRPYHLTNLALHVIATLLVGALYVRFSRSLEPTDHHAARLTSHEMLGASAAALLFGLLPSHSEAVIWIAGRGDLLVTVFLLIALHLWMSEGHRVRLMTGAACISYAAALATKESAVAFLGIVFVIEVARSSRDASTARPLVRRLRPAIAAIVPALAVTVLWFIVRTMRLGSVVGGFGSTVESITPVDIARRWSALLVRSLLPPAPLAVWLSVLVVATAVLLYAGVYATRNRGATLPKPARTAAVSAICALVAAGPVAALGIALDRTSGERLVYLPSVFAVVAIVRLWSWWWEHHHRTALVMGVLTLVGLTVSLQSSQDRWVRSGEEAAELVSQLSQLPQDRPAVLVGISDTQHGVEFMRNAVWPALVLHHGWDDPALVQLATDPADADPDLPRWQWTDDQLVRR